jgi:hypothetical protein
LSLLILVSVSSTVTSHQAFHADDHPPLTLFS